MPYRVDWESAWIGNLITLGLFCLRAISFSSTTNLLCFNDYRLRRRHTDIYDLWYFCFHGTLLQWLRTSNLQSTILEPCSALNIQSQLWVMILGHISLWKWHWKAIDTESTGPGSGICRWSCFGPNSNRIACSCSEHTFRVATLVCGVVGGEIWDSFWMVVGILMINILIININIIWIIISIFIQIRHTHWFIGNKKNIYIFAFWTRKNLWWLIFPLPFIQVHHRHDITITFQESSLPQQQQQQQHRRCDASDEAT